MNGKNEILSYIKKSLIIVNLGSLSFFSLLAKKLFFHVGLIVIFAKIISVTSVLCCLQCPIISVTSVLCCVQCPTFQNLP